MAPNSSNPFMITSSHKLAWRDFTNHKAQRHGKKSSAAVIDAQVRSTGALVIENPNPSAE